MLRIRCVVIPYVKVGMNRWKVKACQGSLATSLLLTHAFVALIDLNGMLKFSATMLLLMKESYCHSIKPFHLIQVIHLMA